jgi:rare lipoprotein A
MTNLRISFVLIFFAFLMICCQKTYVDRDGRVIQQEEPAQKESAENNASPSTATETTETSPAAAETTGEPFVEFGIAAYYNDNLHGKKTASGEVYDRDKMTAAHHSLPYGTMCRVTNMANGKSVEVLINDRCASKGGRILDLSKVAAEQLDALAAGMIDVKVEVIQP